MLYDLSKNNPYDREKFAARVKEMLEKGEVVSLSRHHPTRSNRQNAYAHVLFSYFASEYGITAEEAKQDYFKRLVNSEIFLRAKVNKQGRQIFYLRSSSDLDSAEMTLALEKFRNWSSSMANIYLPAPDEQRFLTYCEKQIEANKEFL